MTSTYPRHVLRRITAMLLSAAILATALVAVDSVVGPPLAGSGDAAIAGPPPTTISLTADPLAISAGQYVTLEATTDLNVANSASIISIVAQTTGSTIRTCNSGTGCAVATRWFTGGPHTFVAKVNALTSTAVVVARQAWTLTFTADKTTFSAGQFATLTATANQNVGSTNNSYRIYIFNSVSGVLVTSCTTGTSCTYTPQNYVGSPQSYVAVVAAAGTPTYSTAADVQATSGVLTITRKPWTLTLTTNKASFAAGESVTLTATADQNVSNTGTFYRHYIFDQTTGALLMQCTTGLTCAFSSSTLIQSGPPHNFVAYVARAGATSIATLQDIQATSNVVAVARQTWTVTLSTNYTQFSVGQSVQLTTTANQNLGGNFRAYIFDKTTNTQIGSCSSGTSCITVPPVFETGGPHVYAAVIAPIGTYSSYAAVTSPEATSNDVTVSRLPWAVSVTMTNATFATGTSASFIFTLNQNLTGSGMTAYVFDTTAGTRVNNCNNGTSCTLAGGSFLTGGPHSYVVVVGSTASNPQTPAQVPNVQVTSTEDLKATRKPWTVDLVATENYVSTVRLQAYPNQTTGGAYSAFIVDETDGVTVWTSGDLFAYQSIWRNNSHIYTAYVASSADNTYPLTDIQAISKPYLNYQDIGAILAGEMTGGSNLAEAAAACSHKDPVNASTGEFYLPATDIGLSGHGPNLLVSRTYSSRSASVDGPFGYGWAANYASKLVTLMAGDSVDPLPRQVQIVQENGSTVFFGRTGDDKYIAPARVMATLVFNAADQTFVFTRQSVEVMVFNLNGRLLATKDLHGNAVTIGYDAAGHVSGLSASGGRSLSFVWDGAHVTQISDSAGRSVSYVYDASGNLTSTVGLDGRVSSYVYDSTHYMTSLTVPGGAVTSNSYDAQHRVTAQTDPLGRVTTFTYGTATTITAPDGSQIVETYVDGRLASKVKAATASCSATTSYTYDTAGNLASATDALGNVTAFTYDAHGNLLSRTDPLGRVDRWTYNANGQPTTATDPAGHVTTMVYNSSGDMVSLTTPSSRVLHWSYNPDGTVASFTNSTGAISTQTYDGAGRLISVTDPDGRTTSLAYDVAGNVVSQTDSAGHSTLLDVDAAGRVLNSTDPNGHLTAYAYDAAGNLSTVTDPSVHVSSSVFDAAGQVTSTTDAAGKVTHFTYTSAGRLASMTDANNHTTSASYNPRGELISVTDAIGRVTSYSYDAAGRPTSITRPSGAISSLTYDSAGQVTSSTDAKNKVTLFGYTLSGQLGSTTDALGRVTLYSYNADKLPSSVSLPGGNSQTYGYNADGQLTAFTNADGKLTSYSYTSAGLLSSKTEPGGLVTAYAYNSAGRPSTITLPDASSAAYSYDPAGQLVGIHYSQPGSTDTSYTYDASGLPLTMTDSTGTSELEYDVLGRMVSETNGAGATIGYDYDDVGQLTSLEYPGDRAVSYEYDAVGQMQSLTDWAGNVTAFNWTPDGQLASQELPNGIVQDNSYDAVGQLTAISISDSAAELASFLYGYDDVGQLVGADTSLNGTTVQRDYGYDALSQLASIANTPGAGAPSTAGVPASPGGLLATTERGASLAYGSGQQVTSLVPAVGPETTFAYDARGSRISSIVAATQLAPAKTTSFSYSASGALASVTTPDVTVSYTSDGRNLRQSRTVDSVTQQFTWSGVAGMPLLLDDGEHSYLYGPSSTPLAQVDDSTGEVQYLHADLLGTPRLITDESGDAIGSVSFDANGNRSGYTGVQSAFGFTGNLTDPDTGLLYLRARDYDPETGQFLTVDPAVDTTRQPYAYAANNPVQLTDPTGLDATDEAVSLMFGAADGLSMGLTSIIFEQTVPGYDCFIKTHNDSFQQGSVTAQVATALIPGVGLLVSAGMLVGRLLVKYAIRAAISYGERYAVRAAEKAAAREAVAGITRGGLGDSYARRIVAGARSDGQTVFAGHGEYRWGSGDVIVPEGTSVNLYSPFGNAIKDADGLAIELGDSAAPRPVAVFEAGDVLPDYTLSAPSGLTIASGSTTVASATRLSDLLRPGMGTCHWAACTSAGKR